MEDTGLPIEATIGGVRSAVKTAGSVVVVAPPGSGKTTVIPLRLLDLVEDKILVLEPRRLATRAAARRMASLLGESVGETVGYVTRHDRQTSPRTRVEVVTEGILTRRLQSDPSLPGVGMVIFDELHERNLQTDLGLALALDARSALRPDLKLVVMSATIDAERIAAFLDNCPVVTADGRLYPVEIDWNPAPPGGRWMEEPIAKVIRRALNETDGDVLVFLPGMGEMRRVRERLSGVLADVRLLHGSLSQTSQDEALAPSTPPFRKVVLATDIAESSLTVEGVSVVVDSGLTRSPRFDPNTGMTRLQTNIISRASADQRAGRAGRLGPGRAYRMWMKMEHAGRLPHTTPEILEVDLAGLVLELASWGVTEPTRLRWLDEPPAPAWNEGVALLKALGGVDDDGQITASGRSMSHLPLHPRLARMVVDAEPEDTWLAILLATIIDERDLIRGRPKDIPTDIAVRVRLLDDRSYDHRGASMDVIYRLRDVAQDLATRAGVSSGSVNLDAIGRLVAMAYPDRLATRRGSPGRFQLRTGTTAVMEPSDTLAPEPFIVAIDLDGKRKDARIRMAAGLDQDDLFASFASEVDESRSLVWDGDRLVDRIERRLGGIVLATIDARPEPSEETARALSRRVLDRGVDALSWSKPAAMLRTRMEYLHAADPEDWPDWSDSGLRRSLDRWLFPHLFTFSSWDEVMSMELKGILLAGLDHEQRRRMDLLAPTHVTVPSGRNVPIDYGRDRPTISIRVQEMYGSAETPTVAGSPITLELLSPASRPVQITSDLAGFWVGSWHEVRKDMAGRYPKHDWPENPATAIPSR